MFSCEQGYFVKRRSCGQNPLWIVVRQNVSFWRSQTSSSPCLQLLCWCSDRLNTSWSYICTELAHMELILIFFCDQVLKQTSTFPLNMARITQAFMFNCGHCLLEKKNNNHIEVSIWLRGQSACAAGLWRLHSPVICIAHHYQTWLIQHVAKRL